MNETKPFTIPEGLVKKAFKLVKANKGTAGVDQQSLECFELKLEDNLYKLWNRMSSGSYFPPPVKAVAIPKKTGGERVLGVPTVTDRIAQTVVKLTMEANVEPYFLPDSYGYRPNKSATDAIQVTRQRCWCYNWVVEYDIKSFFDNVNHELLMRAVRKHTNNKWVILYVERWLKVPIQMPDGSLKPRDKGVPQGGVISPLLANLFLHYVFDKWMGKTYPNMPWARYADDGLVHCTTETQAKQILANLHKRFGECKLELHPDKTKIIYCKDANRRGKYKDTKFTFLGYTFRRRQSRNTNTRRIFVSFTPAVSDIAIKSMRAKTRKSNIRNRTDIELKDIAKEFNPILRGWIEYYGCYCPSALYPVFRHFNKSLVTWIMRKYKKFKGRKIRAIKLLEKIAKEKPGLFVHWKLGIVGV